MGDSLPSSNDIIFGINSIISKGERLHIARIMIDADHAVNPITHAFDQRYQVSVVFIRNDGWLLASSLEFAADAEKLWSKEWIGMVRYGFPAVIRLNHETN